MTKFAVQFETTNSDVCKNIIISPKEQFVKILNYSKAFINTKIEHAQMKFDKNLINESTYTDAVNKYETDINTIDKLINSITIQGE